MPWTVKDVDEHKKGLTSAQKKKWVSVANATLKKCQEEGGENCDAQAIRTANGAVKQNTNNMTEKENQVLDVYFLTTPEAYTVREEQYNGKDYLVAPVTMMVEGVHSGSHGPILHTAEQLGRFPESWNGIPVTIGHPQINGEYVPANNPTVLTEWATGIVFNTRIDGEKLKAEAWVEKDRVQQLSPELYQRLTNGDEIEVSVGVFSDEVEEEGIFNNEQYSAVAYNHRPEHLALLPAEVGACSLVDGCGIRVNRKGGPKVADEQTLIVNEDNQEKIVKELAHKGFAIHAVGFQELTGKAQRMLDNKDANGYSHYLEEIYQNDLIFRKISYDDGQRTEKMYRQPYQLNAAGEVELTGEAVRVKRDIDYTPVPSVNSKQTERVKRKRKFYNNKKNVNNMAKEECTDCVQKLVDGLIANKATAYSEDDRERLEALDEDILEKMTPQPEKEKVQANAKPEKVTREQILEVLSKSPLSINEYLQTAPKEVAEQIRTGMQLNKQRRDSMIAKITANTDVWTKEELEAEETDRLEKLYKVAVNNSDDEESDGVLRVGNYGVSVNVDEDEDDMLLPPGYEVKEESK